MDPLGDFKQQIRQALSDEIKARSAYPKKSTLTNGTRVAIHEESSLYRFEVPENFLFEPSLTVQCSFGTKLRFSVPALIAEVQHQFIFFLFPFDMGEMISEMTCEWNPSETVERLMQRCEEMEPGEIVSTLLARDFGVNTRPAATEPAFPSTFTDSQREAVKKSIARKVSFIVGERKRGKTGVAASLLFNALWDGKRVLYLTSSSGSLHDCMQDAISLSAVVAEESITINDPGIFLFPQLPLSACSVKGTNIAAHVDGLKKLMKVLAAEYEYDRVEALIQRRNEKQRQIEEASADAEALKTELLRLQNASMLQRMRERINKADIDQLQFRVQDKQALIERLKKHASVITKEQFKKEAQLPYQLKEKAEIEKLASIQISLQPSFPPNFASVRCVAATVHQALKMDQSQLGKFHVVCIDDAHVLNLPEFFWCASLALEQCFVIADITEQPPRSICQFESSRKWLQKDYFTFYQQEDSDRHRFTAATLPDNTASELTSPGLPESLFESCLAAATDGRPVSQGAKGKIYLLNTEDQRTVSVQYLGKKKILPYNEANARRVIYCVEHALLNGSTTQSDILIVTPPSGQITYLRELLKAHQMNDIEIASLGSIRLCAKRAVIFDTTVAGLDFTLRILDDRKSGIVHVANTFNTLLSTVREDFYTIADLSYFNARYKDRLVARLLSIFSSRSENPNTVLNAARRFDDMSPELRKKVLWATAAEKQSADYRTKLEQSKPSALDAVKSAPTQSVALAERKLKNDIRAGILRVLAKRDLINIVAQYLEAYPLYKTTLETAKYCSALPDLDCENENDFKSVMDMWNLLIYETSDAQKTKHPLAAKARVDAKVASDIQQLYAYYHSELEFVVEEGKHKLAQSIQKIFNDCIGRKPVTPTDWMNAYLVFLGRMEKYLDTVINQIRT